MPESLVGLLDAQIQSDGKIGKRTYQSISDASLRLSSFLKAHDVQVGDRIMLWGANSPQWVISYFAGLRAGAAIVPFDLNRDPAFLGRIAEATKPRFIIAGEAQRNSLPSGNSIPVLDMEQVDKIAEEGNHQIEVDTKGGDIAEIVFTSGTTGNPKGVVLTHGNILSNVESIKSLKLIRPDHRLLSILPLSHMFETTGGLLTPMASGASIVYADSLQPNRLLSTMLDERITCMAVVPQVLALFKKGVEQQAATAGREKLFSSLLRFSPFLPEVIRRIMFHSIYERMGKQFEFFVCGGAKLDPAVADFWENLGIKVLQGYGMTEASPVVTCDTMSSRDHRYVGRLLPGVEVRVADDGEVLVKGPNVMRGYWNNPSASVQALEEGWYHSGDLGVLENGRLKLMGRKGNMIVLANGFNVYPEDIEEVLSQQGIREAVVFLKESSGKEELHAVLLMGESSEDPQVLIRAANKRLSAHQRISGWTVWKGEDFPRTHTLKAKRQEIISTLI